MYKQKPGIFAGLFFAADCIAMHRRW